MTGTLNVELNEGGPIHCISMKDDHVVTKLNANLFAKQE